MKLISMTDFVLSVASDEELKKPGLSYVLYQINKYANFLKQPLTMGMFVPCDDDGNVLEEPYNYKEYLDGNNLNTLCEEFKESQSKVIFNDFTVRKQSTYSVVNYKDADVWITWNKSKTIETLIYLNLDLAVSF